jgi:hypothetical protein
METIFQHLSGFTSLLCAGALSFIVLTRRVKEGVVIKTGLIMMIGSFLASGVMALKGLDSVRGLANVELLLRVGMLVVVVGYVRRVDYETERDKA